MLSTPKISITSANTAISVDTPTSSAFVQVTSSRAVVTTAGVISPFNIWDTGYWDTGLWDSSTGGKGLPVVNVLKEDISIQVI